MMLDSSKFVSAFNSATGLNTKKSAVSQSDDFKGFRSTFALRQLAVDLNDGEWRYFDGGPKNVAVLLCLPGASGTAETMFKIMHGLCPKGYRVIAAQHPPYYSINEFIVGLDAFLDSVEAKEVHIFGASLGGFLAQQYSLHRPRRVTSLILCNSFWSTRPFAQNGGGLVTPMFQFTPGFVLKNMILSSFDSEAALSAPPCVADALDFVSEQLETMYQGDLASRLTLHCTPLDCAGIRLESDKITIIDSLDKVARPPELREELYSKYPDAKHALCRSGGDFPFLSVGDEVNLYIEVHMRRVGVLVNKPQLTPTPNGGGAQEEGRELSDVRAAPAKAPAREGGGQ
mmetsp:Transcript_29729/g.61070  ORF Transcript_29729/g.61070 Transcript_29729/m.61070 type:complete len:343 (+) Transcript_29729:80-1108(+)